LPHDGRHTNLLLRLLRPNENSRWFSRRRELASTSLSKSSGSIGFHIAFRSLKTTAAYHRFRDFGMTHHDCEESSIRAAFSSGRSSGEHLDCGGTQSGSSLKWPYSFKVSSHQHD
jgi:hypothetical protein